MGRRSSTVAPLPGLTTPPALDVSDTRLAVVRGDHFRTARPDDLVPSAQPVNVPGGAPLTRRSVRAAERASERAASTRIEKRPAVRLAPRTPDRSARHFDLLAARRSRRRVAATASAASIGLVSSLLFALPAYALPSASAFTAVDSHGRTAAQILAVSAGVREPAVKRDNAVAAVIGGIVADQGGVDSATAAAAITQALQAGGPRQAIVETALSYLGDPYVLGGSDHSGIDCSGLTMQAYAAVGIRLVHLVSAQDAVGTVIPESAAKPGDLVVFDDDEHIGIYLGADLLIAAPEAGRPVNVEQVWSGVAHHFIRILPSGE